MLTGLIKRKIKKAITELYEEFIKNGKLEVKVNPKTMSIVVQYRKEF